MSTQPPGTAPSPSLTGRTLRRVLDAGYGTSLYRLSLRGRVPDKLRVAPQDPWPGDVTTGDELFQGRYRFAGREALAPNQPPWRLRPDDDEWMAELHAFGWLRHFRASGGDTARAHMVALIRSWIDLCGEWDAQAWSPEVLARRVVAWLDNAKFVLGGDDPIFRSAFLNSLARQVRHLARVAGGAEAGRPTLAAAYGLIYGGLCLPGEEAKLGRGETLLRRELGWQVLGDGGYVSRSPSEHLAVLRELVGLRAAYDAGNTPAPDELQNAIDRMAPMLRAFRHGDGRLALFNGGFEETVEDIDTVLAGADAKGKPQMNAPHGGYQRLSARRGAVIVDTGGPPPAPLARHAHAGTLSLEMSSGKHRIVVNCGSGADRNSEWQAAAGATAAHSTLTLADTSSAELPASGIPGRRPQVVTVERNADEAGNIWLDLSHDGYRGRFGLVHRRRLYLDASGEDLRGEDMLVAVANTADAAGALPFAVRFHLHPDVQASLVQGGTAVLLKLGGGQGWRFRCAGGNVSVDDSIYLGERGHMRRSQQIAVTGEAGADGASIRWALKKV